MNLVELQDKIYQQNKDTGWHDTPRPFSTFVCLFHSELSEAMEGDRKGLMDDHLPQYPMFQVELADFVIRCLDWLGVMADKGVYPDKAYKVECGESWSRTDFLAAAHSEVSDAFSKSFTSLDFKYVLMCNHIMDAIEISISLSLRDNFDLQKIILEKVEYNKHRADHKRENRAKQGGKKY